MDTAQKIKPLEDIAMAIQKCREHHQKVILCHGCFDLMHPGHIKHFQAAKAEADILVVTVTPDEYIDKGPGRPVYTQQLRAESIAALQCVDMVGVNRWPTADNLLRMLKPDFYAKGQEFEHLEDKTGKIQREYEVVKEIGAQMKFTHEVVFSSTHLINTYLRTS